jgi:hypothetical protein
MYIAGALFAFDLDGLQNILFLWVQIFVMYQKYVGWWGSALKGGNGR